MSLEVPSTILSHIRPIISSQLFVPLMSFSSGQSSFSFIYKPLFTALLLYPDNIKQRENLSLKSDLDGLTQYKRRSPFDEYGMEELINVYLRSDVEKKAVEVWGSLENLNREKDKRRVDYERQKQAVFKLKKTLRDYHKRVEQMENPLIEDHYVHKLFLLLLFIDY